jgi:hypothetical protein
MTIISEQIIEYLKANYNSNYANILKNNFEKNYNNLSYSKEFLDELKDFFYNDYYYLINNNIENIKRGFEISSQNNYDKIKCIENDKFLFTNNDLIIYINESEIIIHQYSYSIPHIEYNASDLNLFLKNVYSSFVNIENKISFENNIQKFCKDEIEIGCNAFIDEKTAWIEYCSSDFFIYNFILFFEKQTIKKNPELKKELSKLLDGDKEINWIPSEPFSKLLENYESIIYDKSADYLLKFVKLDSFLSTKRKSLINIHKEVINTKDEDFIFRTIPFLIKQIEYYNQLLLLSINMLVALKNNKMILFFKIYETFDQIGVFDSNWEKSLLNKMDELNISIKDLVNHIQQMEMRLNQKIEDLGFEIQSSIDQMKENVIEEVSSIKNLDNGSASSILSLINTFQLIGLSNKLK